ncbi:YbgA family protein [Vibrio sp. LaRot3]|uniref:YbgA family protein n=1 Tax=Vibrio sp. LaRot3 TaxID=2998829 RepID=UPI0022CE24CA|nr:DUF523 and DUF1722 domain-containing protein [Vibrio sp. LaRot3]MDA0148954.1 DUF523 and DUF1722 domain-containing protein [Vibrio sp. LaRot3]
MDTKIKVGVSACVLGEKVRFDGGHKRSRFVHQELATHFDFLSICPEVESGMPVPRPTIRLISDKERVALVETKDATKEHTQTMVNYAEQRVSGLAKQDLCGYIVCAKSPTCGMERVKIYGKHNADNNGVGLYTQQLMKQMPWLPIEEDGRLNDPVLKENFVARVFCLNDFYQSMAGEPTPGKIVAFHSRYKLTLMAHHPASYKALGKLVANVKDYQPEEFYHIYRNGLMTAMTHRASRKNNTNVLMHIQGYFKRNLQKSERAELTQTIHDYRVGVLPLLAPLVLLKHHMSRYPSNYLNHQTFFNPHPQELRLRYGL